MGNDYWITEFDGPDGLLKIMLSKETTVYKEGFAAEPRIYPVTIVLARYGGAYEGGFGQGSWLCFPVSPHHLSEPEWADWCASDIECMTWWDRAQRAQWPIGGGSSPDAAYASLLEQVAAKAGVNLADLAETPTWSRDELKAREE